MFDLSGASQVQVKIFDTPSFAVDDRTSVGMIPIRADRGEPSKAIRVNTEQEFIRIFGKRNTDASVDDLLYIRLLLRTGIKLWVSRIVHYTDIADANTIEGTKATITLTVATDDATFTAKHVGVGYNGVEIETRAAISGLANAVDVLVTLPDIAITQTILDVPNAPTATQIEAFNTESLYIDLDSFTNLIPVGTAMLASGVQDLANIVTLDYVGDETVENGLTAFDSISDSTRMLNIRPVPAINQAFDNYVSGRSARTTALFGFPIGLNGSGYLDYVKGEGAYASTAYLANDELVSYTGGTLGITDPDNPDSPQLETQGCLYEFVLTLLNDATGKIGSSPAAEPANVIPIQNSGVIFDLASGNNKANFWDELSLYGVNIITNKKINVNSSATVAVIDGNKTAKLDQKSLLSQKNIVDTVNWIAAGMGVIYGRQKNKKNIPSVWAVSAQIVEQEIVQPLISDEAIQPQEGDDWVILGDQNVTRVADAVINDPERVPFGEYQVYFVFKPNGAMTHIGVGVVPTTEGTYNIVVQEKLR